MATRSPGYNRLGLSIILSSLPLPSQGIFSFFHCTPFLRCPQPKVPPCLARAIARSASDLPSFRLSSCCRPVARSARVFLCVLSFFLKKKVRSDCAKREQPFPFRPPSCCQPVARSVRVFLCILSFFLKKKVWEIPTKYGIMERIDEHLFRAAGGTQFF